MTPKKAKFQKIIQNPKCENSFKIQEKVKIQQQKSKCENLKKKKSENLNFQNQNSISIKISKNSQFEQS